MELRRFGFATRTVPAIGQGTWNMDGDDQDLAVSALRRGIDLGLTHIDTAEMYGDAELLVAQAIAGRRDEIFLVDKVLPSNASRKGTLAACERSLKRLKTDHLDCYLLHWRGQFPLEDTVGAFETLLEKGKILSWGVSNFDVVDLEEIAEIKMPACNQVLYHLQERAIEHAVIPWCEKHRLAVVAYSPFGSGNFPNSRVLEEIAAAHRATPRQVALRFLLRYESVLTIPKASNPRHTEENAGADHLVLSELDIKKIDAAFPRGKPRSLPMI